MFRLPEEFRLRDSVYAQHNEGPKGGYFLIDDNKIQLLVRAVVNAFGQEIICAKIETRLPSCELFMGVKSHFWDESDAVIVDNDPFMICMYRPGSDDYCYKAYPPGMMSYFV